MFLYKSVQIFGLSYKWTISPEKDLKEQQFKSYFSCGVSLLCSLASSYHYSHEGQKKHFNKTNAMLLPVSQSSALYDTIVSTLWTVVENDLSRTSSEFAMILAWDSSQVSGTSWSLLVYASKSNAPGNNYKEVINHGE